MVMDALPPHVREEMQRRAFEIIGLDHTKPDAYDENGRPLWYARYEDKARTATFLTRPATTRPAEVRFSPLRRSPEAGFQAFDFVTDTRTDGWACGSIPWRIWS